MRIQKTFGERSGKERIAARKFYLVYEGANTEAKYFEGIEQNKSALNIDSLIEIVPILRSYNEQDWSNPKKILDKLIEYICEKDCDKMSKSSFIDKVIDWLLEEQIIGDKGVYTKDNLKPIILNLLQSEPDLLDLKEATQITSNFLVKELNISASIIQIEDYIKRQFVTYEEGHDKICLIADRDKQSFKEDQYDYVVKTCNEKGYEFYISNPCFELWLLMHYDEILTIDKEKLLTNPKETPRAKKRFLEKQLSILMDGYNKNNLKFEKLIPLIEHAIKNEKNFCENIENLKTDLGCNIGLLIEKMQRSI